MHKKSRNDGVGKAIHWELRKRLKFHHTTKWYKHKRVQKNETHKILWDFKIQADYRIPVRRRHLVLINKIKKNLWILTFCRTIKWKSKKAKRFLKKYLNLPIELKKKMGNIRVTVIWILVGAIKTVPKDLEKRLEG